MKRAVSAVVFGIGMAWAGLACAAPEPGSSDWHFEVSKGIAIELADSPSWKIASAYLRDIGDKSQDWNLLLLQAKVELQQGNLEQAEAAVQRALSLYPDNPRILAMAGNVASDMGKQLAAEKYYLRTLEIQPHNVPVLTAMARIYSGRQDWESVVHTYETLIQVAQPTSEVWVRLATAWEKLENLEQAEYCLVQNLSIHPNRMIALLALERFYQRTGNEAKYQETSKERLKIQQKVDGDTRNLRALPSSSR